MKNFQNFENFRKNWVFEKKVQTLNCFKIFVFWVMTKEKKLQRDFLMKNVFPQKNVCARVCARGTQKILSCLRKWKKSYFFLAVVVEISTGGNKNPLLLTNFCCHHLLHKIFYLLTIYNFFISLKAEAVCGFEKRAFLVPKMHVRVKKKMASFTSSPRGGDKISDFWWRSMTSRGWGCFWWWSSGEATWWTPGGGYNFFQLDDTNLLLSGRNFNI